MGCVCVIFRQTVGAFCLSLAFVGRVFANPSGEVLLGEGPVEELAQAAAVSGNSQHPLEKFGAVASHTDNKTRLLLDSVESAAKIGDILVLAPSEGIPESCLAQGALANFCHNLEARQRAKYGILVVYSDEPNTLIPLLAHEFTHYQNLRQILEIYGARFDELFDFASGMVGQVRLGKAFSDRELNAATELFILKIWNEYLAYKEEQKYLSDPLPANLFRSMVMSQTFVPRRFGIQIPAGAHEILFEVIEGSGRGLAEFLSDSRVTNLKANMYSLNSRMRQTGKLKGKLNRTIR